MLYNLDDTFPILDFKKYRFSYFSVDDDNKMRRSISWPTMTTFSDWDVLAFAVFTISTSASSSACSVSIPEFSNFLIKNEIKFFLLFSFVKNLSGFEIGFESSFT